VQKYRDGKMQRTLKRELKGPETDRKEALDICIESLISAPTQITLQGYAELLQGRPL